MPPDIYQGIRCCLPHRCAYSGWTHPLSHTSRRRHCLPAFFSRLGLLGHSCASPPLLFRAFASSRLDAYRHAARFAPSYALHASAWPGHLSFPIASLENIPQRLHLQDLYLSWYPLLRAPAYTFFLCLPVLAPRSRADTPSLPRTPPALPVRPSFCHLVCLDGRALRTFDNACRCHPLPRQP